MSTKLCSTFLLNYKVVGEPVVYKLGVLFPTPPLELDVARHIP